MTTMCTVNCLDLVTITKVVVGAFGVWGAGWSVGISVAWVRKLKGVA